MPEEFANRFEGLLQGLEKTLTRFDKALFGNGQPGVVDRMARIEENIDNLLENSKATGEQIKSLASSVSELKGIVQGHTNDLKVHSPQGLLLRKEVITYVILGMAFVHTLLPQELSLWELVKKVFGL